MVSRLYPSNKLLYCQIFNALVALGLYGFNTPLWLELTALYISGLIFLDKRQTATRISDYFPGRSHDAINRLLRVMSISTRALMVILIEYAKSFGVIGYLALDDVVVEKRFSKKLLFSGWAYGTSRGCVVYGIHIVYICWCYKSIKIPVNFRIWRPKDSCSKDKYKTKIELARDMVIELLSYPLENEYLVPFNLVLLRYCLSYVIKVFLKH